MGILLSESKTKRFGKFQYLITYPTILLWLGFFAFSVPSQVLAAEKVANVDLSTAITRVASCRGV